jgi:hypothetical protein
MTEQECKAYQTLCDKFHPRLHRMLSTGNLVFMVMRRRKDNPKMWELVDVNTFRHPVPFWTESTDLINYVEFMCKKHRLPIPGPRSYAGYEHINGVKGNFIETGNPDYKLYYSFCNKKKRPCECIHMFEAEPHAFIIGDRSGEYFCEYCFFEQNNILIQDIL